MHARQGRREAYRPIETPLCAGSAPQDVAAALLRLAPFRRLYVADLDAIAGGSGHDATLRDLAGAHLGLDLWVDAGEAAPAAVACRAAEGPGRPVVGSESVTGLEEARAALGVEGCVFSLDFGPEGPRGPAALHADAGLWPEEVIVMTLARVGAGGGPDIERLGEVMARAGGRRIYAAGGVRHADDLARLADLGCAGVLLASALHDGRLTRREIESHLR